MRYDGLMFEPGDGRVPRPSLLAREMLDLLSLHDNRFPTVAYWFFLCERRDQLATT